MVKFQTISFTIFLFFTSFHLFSATIENKVTTFCKVWGVCKYYGNHKTDWDEVFLKDYKSIAYAKNKKEFNKNILLFLGSSVIKCTTNDTSISNQFLLQKWKVTDTTATLRTNFDWIKEEALLDVTNKQKLIQILLNYKPRKTKNIKSNSGVLIHKQKQIHSKYNRCVAK